MLKLNFNNLSGKEISIKKGNYLFRAGEIASSFYLVLEGALKQTWQDDSGAEENKISRENQFLGFDELYSNGTRRTNSIAQVDSKLLEISLKADNSSSEKISSEKLLNDMLPEKEKSYISHIGTFSKTMSVSIVNDISIVMVNLHRCNYSQAQEFKKFLFKVIDDGARKVLIDLQQTKVIDSTFLGTLVAGLRKMKSAEGDLRLVCSEQISSWLFLITRMDKVFKIYSDLESAVNDFY